MDSTKNGWVKGVIENADVTELPPPVPVDTDRSLEDLYDNLREVCKAVQIQRDEMDRTRRMLDGYQATLQKQLRGITALLGEVVLLRNEIEK